MKNLAKTITKRLISYSNTSYSKDDIEVFLYGIECFLNSAATDIILFAWGLLTHTLIETICWLIVFCTYRHYAGGAHAKTSELCIIFSSLLGMFNYVIVKYAKYILTYYQVIVIFSYFVCIILAPAKSSKKNLNKKERLKNKAFSTFFITICLIACDFTPTTIAATVLYSISIANILIIITLLEIRVYF